MPAINQQVLDEVRQQRSLIEGINTITQTWSDDRAELKQKLEAALAQIEEGLESDDGEVSTTELEEAIELLNQGDTVLENIRAKLSSAVVENTPSSGAASGTVSTPSTSGNDSGSSSNQPELPSTQPTEGTVETQPTTQPETQPENPPTGTSPMAGPGPGQ